METSFTRRTKITSKKIETRNHMVYYDGNYVIIIMEKRLFQKIHKIIHTCTKVVV